METFMTPSLLRTSIRYALLAGSVASLSALAPGAANAQETSDEAQDLDRIQVTGSRIKRADIEGALPVTVITREQIQASGDVSVAEFLRDTTFNSTGSFRPQSGSSAQAFAEIDLRGLGSNRTLVLVDGRRAPKAPFVGSASDVNAIPLAAVERIEILTDGASAIYGSDAIGGVVNIITRKDYNGAEFTYGFSNPSYEGGETEEGSMIFGTSGDRGRLLAGASFSKRGMVFTRERPWGVLPGASAFGNNYVRSDDPDFTLIGVPGGCNEVDFRVLPDGSCVYNFNSVAADEAKLTNQAAFARGDYQINDDWSTYMSTTVSRVESFGRYAPVPGFVTIDANSPNNPTAGTANPVDVYLYHRFSAAGNRDNTTDANVYDLNFGFQGTIGQVDVDVGLRQTEYKFVELGRNYIVRPLAEQFINDGSYDILNPSQNPADILNAIKTTTARESRWLTQEAYALANFDLFEMAGGTSGMAIGAEFRSEEYSDQYDSLSEAGVIEGSSGNSAAGTRDVTSVYAEWLLPVVDNLEISLAARYEDYSDYGNDLAPKVALRYQPLDNLTLRASWGEGFAAPTLDILTQKDAFSADTVFDPQNCIATSDLPLDPADLGGLTPEEYCNQTGGFAGRQINATRKANPNLESEQSTQWSAGVAWDATSWLNLTLDYYNIEIENRVRFYSSQDLVNIDAGLVSDPFPGAPCSITRAPNGRILLIENCYFNEGTVETDGFDLTARTNFEFGDWGTLRNQLNVSYVAGFSVDGGEDQVGILSFPEFRATLLNTWEVSDFAFNWNLRHIDGHGTQRFQTYSSQTLHDLQVSWNTPWNGVLAVGVNNVENELPELIAVDGRNFDFALYDAYGRTPYLRYTQKF
jgi:iron complex outermembrane receptor protein